MPLLTVSGIAKHEERGFALTDIYFTQERYQNLAIAGETGSGKSTLLKIIAGLVQADAGDVYIEQDKIKGPGEKLVAGHPQIAYLSQQYELPQFLRVEQVLRYVNTLSDSAAATLYEVCRITHLLKRKTDQLSGGERQRIALARLLSTAPSLLLLDEPYSNLDMLHKTLLKQVIQDVGEQLKISCILVSHDPLDTLSWAQQILVMKEGKVLQKDTPEKIYQQPVNEYVAGLFGKYNLLSPALVKKVGQQHRLKPGRKSLLLRPEHFRLQKTTNALQGIVKNVAFYGSYYELDVSSQKHRLIIHTPDAGHQAGDHVFVSLSSEALN